MSRLTWAGALALGFGIGGSASGAVVTVLSDPFTDGTRAHGTDVLDGSWFANSSATGNAPAVTTDALLPDRGATNTNALGWQPAATFRSLLSGFAPQALGTVGDSITATLDFRFVATPGNWLGGGFRIGLYGDNGTPATGDNASTNDPNDVGYYISVSTGAVASSNSAFRELGGTGDILGGTDRTALTPSTSTATSIDDTDAHTAVLTLTRTATGLNLLAQIDGSTVLNVNDTASPQFLFNELAVSPANNTSAIRIDNVVVQSNIVPEPSSALVLLALPAALATRRRRR